MRTWLERHSARVPFSFFAQCTPLTPLAMLQLQVNGDINHLERDQQVEQDQRSTLAQIATSGVI